MTRKSRTSLRLDIVGLVPRLFDQCLRNTQSLLESRPKGGSEVSDESRLSAEELGVSNDILEVHRKVSSIAIDLRRAYGRVVEIRVFEKSSNRLVNILSRARRHPTAFPSGTPMNPEFRVNGVQVFVGIPQSFSQLDEAIDRAFNRPMMDDRGSIKP